MKRIPAVILSLMMILLLVAATAETAEKEDTYLFTNREANYETNRIALTMDDCYEIDQVVRTIELCKKYGIAVTFFPLGQQIFPEDREIWQSALDAGCEIGSHTYFHNYMFHLPTKSIISSLGKTQQALDEALGYHYEIRWMRPPFGKIKPSDGSETSARVVAALRTFGYQHAVTWNVSQTDPELAVKQIKPGCIALYHARNKDVNCLETIIPQLLEMGYEPVTLSELLGFDPPVTGEEKYVYDEKNYGY